MSIINAWQHIYSNVEKEQSPQGQGGFQTLFHSSGLSEQDVEEMEGRLLYFASQVEPTKRLFFTTASGKGVAAQVVFLPSPDQFGRGGRYFAHALAFAPEDLLSFEADPFRVFRTFPFITTVTEALAQGDFESGIISSIALNLPDKEESGLQAAGKWPLPELQKLALLALRVEQQTRARNAITVTGPPEQIEAALEAAFIAVPVSMRPGCSFDTYFYRCNLVATYYWAIGLPEPPVSVKFVHIESQSRQVYGEAPTQPKTAYERWVMQTIEAGQVAELPSRKERAFAVSEWLDGRSYNLDLLNQASSDLIEQIFKASPQSVQESLRRGVSQKLPAELAERAAAYLYQHTSGAAVYRQLRQGFELSRLSETLYESYAAENFKEPARQEVRALATLLEQVEHKLLRLFVAYWTSTRNDLPKALKWAEKADYQQFGKIVLRLKLVTPLDLLIPGRADDFLDVYLASAIDELPELVEALVEAEEFARLTRLNPYVAKLSRKDLNKLTRLVAKHDQTPVSFQQAVNNAAAALPAEKGLAGKLKSVWRNLSGG